ncbi:ABC transporter, permease protein [Gleimia coleocanis DSM 15436]|uniref:ABC transporter, permease protein n=1 Tax=Gleimia coleocanis DSM 15436 TaxID=525245 RepID=C0VZ65_9ACTO|nr:ABC transporter permease subunit [Gleimia coleocanis]EEH64718.1 ABC transporter, permease protein [Gleimia coleocanis DSM 15436]
MNFFVEAFMWLADSANWWGSDGVFTRVLEHAGYSLLCLLAASLLAIPLGLYIGHTGRLRSLVILSTGSLRAIPTLGLLSLFGLLLGIGAQAPLLALVVLATPTILAGTYAGVESVNPQTVDAAYAQGMTSWQVLWKVQFPLASGLILGSLRSAMLQLVSTVTLVAYLGGGGLGRYLFRGLGTQNYSLMLVASLLVIVIAIFFEGVFAQLQRVNKRKIHI